MIDDKINISDNTPITTVNIPIFFDLVQPAKEIIINNEIIPKINELNPTVLEKNKSFIDTFSGNPSVVLMMISVIENKVIKKKQAAVVENAIILFNKRPFALEIKKLATTVIENPASKEHITLNPQTSPTTNPN